MSKYRVVLTPGAPYFLGSEKSFVFPGQTEGRAYANSYFIRSEETPSQSTVLGMLRYILIPHKWEDIDYNKSENDIAVGKESFDIDINEKQSFGKIHSVSPVFITDGKSDYIPAPLNDNSSLGIDENYAENGITRKKYVPFEEYKILSTSLSGEKLYTEEFDAKQGLSRGFLNLTDKYIYNNLIYSSTRVGINRKANQDGFFKKEYKMLKKGYSFAFYADIDMLVDEKPKTVYLGQGKSPFSVKFTSVDDCKTDEKIKAAIGGVPKNYTLIYCFGDTVLNQDPCMEAAFSAYKTKFYRAFITQRGGKPKKGKLHRLIAAGSIFLAKDTDEFVKMFKNENAQQIGFNYFIQKEGTENAK